MKRPWLSPEDHAFASGPAFPHPEGYWSALRMTRSPLMALRVRAHWRRISAAAEIAEGVRLGLGARVINRAARERARIGRFSVVRGLVRVESNGRIEIGDFVYIGDDVILSAGESLSIGDHTLVAHGVQIFDNDTHPIHPADREAHFRSLVGQGPKRPFPIASAPVHIGRHCWIGMQSLVMKGVEIGDYTIVAAGSVVTKSLPPGVVATGNPARPRRSLAPVERREIKEA